MLWLPATDNKFSTKELKRIQFKTNINHPRPTTTAHRHLIKSSWLLGLNSSQFMITAFNWQIRSVSSSFNKMLHFCMNDSARQMASVGGLGKNFSIAILFLVVQTAQANPAKTHSVKRLGKGPLPSSHVLVNSIIDFGYPSQSKISLNILQIILTRGQEKRRWYTISMH